MTGDAAVATDATVVAVVGAAEAVVVELAAAAVVVVELVVEQIAPVASLDYFLEDCSTCLEIDLGHSSSGCLGTNWMDPSSA